MATPEDLSQLGDHLRPLAGLIHAAAVGEGGPWVVAVLDVRFTDHDGGFIDKIRVERPDGSTGCPSLPVEAVHRLIALGQERPAGPDRWHGLILQVTAEGACEVRLNYDPACAEDRGFFAS
jgi:hypothetical protein